MSTVKIKEAIKVVIGAGEHSNNSDWIQTQESDLDLLNETHWKSKFKESSIDAILAEHVWEHLTYEEGKAAAINCFTYLKPNGYIRCAVPDGYFPDENYQQVVQIGGPGPSEHPAASHKIVHNYTTLKSMFEEAGYKVQLLEYCNENGEFIYNDWNEKEGFIYRSKRFDHRNAKGKLGFVSVIIDAIKP